MQKPNWVAILLAIIVSQSALAENVALNKPVTISGFPIDNHPAAITDGSFIPDGAWWLNNGNYESQLVYWGETPPVTMITVNLLGAYTITGVIVQADDNDTYLLEYKNLNGVWSPLYTLPNYYASYGDGMQTRPNPHDDSEAYMLTSPVTATELRISATSGDNYYSVSEIQAFTPEPASCLLMAIGLAFARRSLTNSARRR